MVARVLELRGSALAPALALAVSLLPLGGVAGQVEPPSPGAVVAMSSGEPGPPTPPAEVPFVGQGRLLCGAAALAMVFRAWGVRDVHPRDWAYLVRPSEGGIRTDDLASAAAAGPGGVPWRLRAGSLSGPAELHELLDRGPVIVLLESGGDAYHYVVVLEMDAREVRLHDPAIGPGQRVSRGRFEAAWTAAGRWSLLALPPEGMTRDRTGTRRHSPPPSPAVLRASRLFRAGRYREAAESAGSEAPRIAAASLYLAGREDEALAAWSDLGDARLDHVRIDGLDRTRYPVVLEHLGLRLRSPLRPDALLRARRRLESLPSLAATRLSWRPVRGGRLADVRAAVVERPSFFPAKPLAWLATGLRALGTGRASLQAGLTGEGDAWRLRTRWTGPRREAELSLAVPGVGPLPGVTRLAVRRVLESHAEDAEAVTTARLGVEDWATGTLRWRAAFELWKWSGDRLDPGGAMGLQHRSPDGRSNVDLDARIANGPAGAWARLDLAAAVRDDIRGSNGDASWEARVWYAAVTSAAPLVVLPGAGTGRVRDHLLRAHDLSRGDRLAGPSLAPRLAGGTLEAVRWTTAGALPLRLGVATFLDGTLPSGGASDRLLLDAGVGLRAGVAGFPGTFRLDGAIGLTDDAHAISIGWSPADPGSP